MGPRLTAFFLASAFLFISCSKSSTSVVAPSADKCSVSATNTPGSFTSTGGTGTVTVSASRDCTWSATPQASWIALQGAGSGQGEASLPFTVQRNPTPAARTGTIAVGSQQLTVSEAGAPCRFDLNRSRDTIGSGGGRLTVEITTLTGCGWSASSNASWISIVSSQTGSASATVVLAVAANLGDARVGSVNVAGQIYTVNQDAPLPAPAPPATPAPAPTPTPSPTPAPPPSFTPKMVDFSGRVTSISGKCPALTMKVDSDIVQTGSSTDYKHGKCGDLSAGDEITGSGLTRQDGTIAASSIDFKKGK